MELSLTVKEEMEGAPVSLLVTVTEVLAVEVLPVASVATAI